MRITSKIFAIIFCGILLSPLAAQKVGIGTTSPNSSSALDITSTSGGLLMPRMTTQQRLAIPTPAVGSDGI